MSDRPLKAKIVGGGRLRLPRAKVDPDLLKEPAALPDSPAQARARAEGKPIPKSSPDFAKTVIKGGRGVFEYWAEPALPTAAPVIDGQRVTREFTTVAEEEKEAEARERAEREPRMDHPTAEQWEAIHAAAAERRVKRELAERGAGK